MSLIGRQAELESLTRAIDGCFEDSAGRIIMVEGPAGVGKTTLVSEVLSRTIEKWPSASIARGRCVQTFGGGDPYLVFVDALRDLSDQSTAGAVNPRKLGGLLREIAPHWLQVVPIVGNVLAATVATASSLQGTRQPDSPAGAPSREALFVQYLKLISDLAAQSPLLIFLDDLHWADNASIALLSYLSRGLAAQPVAMVATLRNIQIEQDEAALGQLLLELEREGLGVRVRVGELDESSLEPLLEAEFEGEVSPQMRRWVFQAAGGNPLFVTELGRLLRQTGGAVFRDGEWHVGEGTGIDVPRSAEAVIERRLQRLDPEPLNVLQYASIDGNEFDSVVLSKLLGRDELELLDLLQELEQRHGLIQCTGETDLPGGDFASEYRFHHALVQTVLYQQVVGKRRVLLHRKAGEVLEALWSSAPERVAGRLARHFDQGRSPVNARRYAWLAAESAASVFANWEAIDFFEIVRRNDPDPADSRRVLERLGDVHDLVGRYGAGIEFYRQALALCTTPAGRLGLSRKIATLERKAGLAPAPELEARIMDLLAGSGEFPAERMHLLLELTRLPAGYRNADAAAEAVRLAEALGDDVLRAAALERLAVTFLFLEGRTADAFPPLLQAQGIAESIGDPVLTARCHSIAAVAHAKLGRYRDALGEFESVLHEYERMGDPNGIGAACVNAGIVMLRLGRYGDAEHMLDRATRIHERRDRAGLLQSLLGLAECSRLQGDPAQAIHRYGRGLAFAREFQYWDSEALLRAGIGLCRLDLGDTEGAREQVGPIGLLLAEHEHWFEDRDLVELFLAAMEVTEGRPADAINRLAAAESALSSRDVYLWARTALERVRLLAGSEPAAARESLEKIIERTKELQSPPITAGIAELQSRVGVPAIARRTEGSRG